MSRRGRAVNAPPRPNRMREWQKRELKERTDRQLKYDRYVDKLKSWGVPQWEAKTFAAKLVYDQTDTP